MTNPVRTIWRYEVPNDGPITIGLTDNPVAIATALVGLRWGIEFWAEHNESKPEVPRTFVLVGTGREIPPHALYIGTAPRTPAGLVWHLYELAGEVGT